MTKIITEAELLTVDLGGYSDALLISDPEDKDGVLAYAFRPMAPLSSPHGEGQPLANQLLILVDGEVNSEALQRVASTLNSRTGRA